MEEPKGAQYAIQIAVQTLKERCKILQQRVAMLEDENLQLRMQNTKSSSNNSLNYKELEMAAINEQNQQLSNKFKMVQEENQELWGKLSDLNKVNQNLTKQLTKIKDSLNQHTKNVELHMPLIRSKTFTQDEPQTKVLQRNLEENNRITTDLEEISLKINNSLMQGKHELDSLCSELAEFQISDNIISESCGFYYEDDFSENIDDGFNSSIDELKHTKELLDHQTKVLQEVVKKVKILEENKKLCDKKIEVFNKSTSVSTENLAETSNVNERFDEPSDHSDDNKICPICSKVFPPSTDYETLTEHVEKHFTSENEFEVL